MTPKFKRVLPRKTPYFKSTSPGLERPAEKPFFDYLHVGLASPELIRKWATRPGSQFVGRVVNAETLHYKTSKPYIGGLFCEQIFGPVKDWTCRCGKYKRKSDQDTICGVCNVEVTTSYVRRHRMGCLELPTPVAHIWYLKARPSKIAVMLNFDIKLIDRIVYSQLFVVTDSGLSNNLHYRDTLTFSQWQDFVAKYPESDVVFSTGAIAIKKLLEDLDLEEEASELRHIIPTAHSKDRTQLIRRLRLINQFLGTNSNPAWMILDVLPIMPPELRPLIKMGEGFFVSSELNDLYRRVILRCGRYDEMIKVGMTEAVLYNARRLIQEAVDCLLDNGRNGKPYNDSQGRPLKSLSDIIKGKEGRFRRDLLGKRVDYSGRTVIVSGSNVGAGMCGLPKEMAIVLFEPFIIHKLVNRGWVRTVVGAKAIVKRWYRLSRTRQIQFWYLVRDVISGHPIILNRAPTLHKFSIQSFGAVLVDGLGIALHHCVCPGYNADFDGDQVAVHLPLTMESIVEARYGFTGGIDPIRPDGEIVYLPTQDSILGAFSMTCEVPSEIGKKPQYFYNCEDVLLALRSEKISVVDPIWLRLENDVNVVNESETDSFGGSLVERQFKDRVFFVNSQALIKVDSSHQFTQRYLFTTAGRVLFNVALSQKKGGAWIL